MAADLGRHVPGQPQRGGLPEDVDLDLDRGQHLGEADALLHRLRHFLVVERVARRVDQAAAIGDRHAAPAVDQLGEARRAALARARPRARRGSRGHASMNSSAISRSCRFQSRAHRLLAALGDQRLVARQKFLDLHRVIGQRLGRGVDRGQAAADHDDRQPHGQVGDAVGLGGAGQLQRHQEIGRLPHARRETVLHRDHGRPAGAGAQRDMVEAERRRRCRSSACRRSARRRYIANCARRSSSRRMIFRKFLSQRTVMPYSATPPNPAIDAVVEPLAQARDVADRRGTARARRRAIDAGDFRRQRLDLQPVDRRDEVAVIHQVMRQGEPRRARARPPAPCSRIAGFGSGRRRSSGFQRVSRP